VHLVDTASNYLATGGRVLRRMVERQPLRAGSEKGVGIIGWAGHGNLGDESIRDAIGAMLPEIRFYPFGGKRVEAVLARAGYSGTGVFRSVLVGGGTLVNEGYLPLVEAAAQSGMRVALFGTGVGSSGFSEDEGGSLRGWAPILERAGAVGVRGPVSRERLRTKCGFDAEIVGDVALQWTLPVAPAAREKARLVINLSSAGGVTEGEPIDSIVRSVGAIVQEFRARGGEVVLMALGEHDATVLRKLAGRCGLGEESLLSIRQSTPEFLQEVSGATAMICVRLHAAVLACCAGVPPIVFQYRDKCRDFMASMELDNYVVGYEAPECERVGEVWERVQSRGAGLRAEVFAKARHWQSVQRAWLPKVRSSLVG
jgi:polysaccharide pyruvyl transferase WcaK-like protein